MIVKVGNLQEFMQEVRLFSGVRLSSYEITTYRDPMGNVELCLELMGFNDVEELVWLHFSVQLQLTPGSHEPWTEHGKAVYKAFPGLVSLVKSYLTGHYVVRPGMYGIARDIVPLGGDLDIVRWDAKTQAFVRVETDALEKAQANTPGMTAPAGR